MQLTASSRTRGTMRGDVRVVICRRDFARLTSPSLLSHILNFEWCLSLPKQHLVKLPSQATKHPDDYLSFRRRVELTKKDGIKSHASQADRRSLHELAPFSRGTCRALGRGPRHLHTEKGNIKWTRRFSPNNQTFFREKHSASPFYASIVILFTMK